MPKVIRGICVDKLLKSIEAVLKAEDDDLSNQLDEEGFPDSDKQVKHINKLEDSICDILEEEYEFFATDITEFEMDAQAYLSLQFPSMTAADLTAAKIKELFFKDLKEHLPKLATLYIEQSDSALSVTNLSYSTQDFISSWSEQLGEMMQVSSHKKLTDIIQSGITNGESISDIAIKIQDAGIRTNPARARSTAITEVLRANSYANLEAMQQSPAVQRKTWRHTGAYKNEPRQNHVNMDGQTVDKFDKFTLTGADGATYEVDCPRDTSLPAAESVNCHCTVIYLVDDDILGFTLEEREAMQEQALQEWNEQWIALHPDRALRFIS